jgi:hypothetical protein
LRSAKHIAIFSNHASVAAPSGAPKNSRKFDLLEFPAEATYNGWRAWWNLRGCRRPGLVSVQPVDQCLRHALKRPYQPHDITNCDLFMSENLLASLGLNSSGVDATGGIAPPPLAPRRLPLQRPLTMITVHAQSTQSATV